MALWFVFAQYYSYMNPHFITALWVNPCRKLEIRKNTPQFIYFIRQKYLISVSLLFDIWVRVETHQSSLAEEGCEKVSEPVEQTLD